MIIKPLILLSIISGALFLSSCGGGGGNSSPSESQTPVSVGTQLSGSCALRITNGEQCSLGKGPIALLVTANAQGKPLEVCTGAFISDHFVLTAAHCFGGASGVGIQVGSEIVGGKAIFVPPQYSFGNQLSAYDVALVELTRPISGVSILPLLISEIIETGAVLNIAGFGQDELGKSVATGLAVAQGLNKGQMFVDQIDVEGGIISALYDRSKQSVCSGDSGSPAVVLSSNRTPGIVAVAQAVSGGDSTNNPSCLAGTVAYFTSLQTPVILNFIRTYVPNVGVI